MKKSSSSGMNMHSGLSRKSPPGVDKSMSIPSGNTVNEGTRDSTAKTPATLGGRCA